MPQNIVSLTVSPERLAAVQQALASLEASLADLVELSVDQRIELVKMGPRSEAFVREGLTVLEANPELLPRSFDLEEMRRDLTALDTLRPLFHRLRRLTARADDTEMALGSDLSEAVLDGYRFAKAGGKGVALDALRAAAASRFGGGGTKSGDTPAPDA
ncbi:hypothetical protein [Zoogloea sp.]|jgi:hypothetical protein|uniref:hypothetical protein n=1 Tax=Zoogloea sp. TaxID=49181 RepID=UPI0035B1F20C